MGDFRIVVIPVAQEQTNPTLALAIDSIRRHTDYDVVTIGHDHGVAEHIYSPQSELLRDRWANTDRAMRVACENFEHFIWSADDIYWTRPAEPVRWAIGELATTLRKGKHGPRKQATLAWLREQGLSTWDYEAHVPMPIESAPMQIALDKVNRSPLLDKRTVYGNLTGEPDLVAPDVKMRDDSMPDAPWISSVGARHMEAIAAHIQRPPHP